MRYHSPSDGPSPCTLQVGGGRCRQAGDLPAAFTLVAPIVAATSSSYGRRASRSSSTASPVPCAATCQAVPATGRRLPSGATRRHRAPGVASNRTCTSVWVCFWTKRSTPSSSCTSPSSTAAASHRFARGQIAALNWPSALVSSQRSGFNARTSGTTRRRTEQRQHLMLASTFSTVTIWSRPAHGGLAKRMRSAIEAALPPRPPDVALDDEGAAGRRLDPLADRRRAGN